MIRRLWIVAAVAICLITSPGFAKDIGGVNLPDTLMAGKENLVLNGAGLRKKFFVKVYAGGLYLTQKTGDGAGIIATDAPMAIRMHFIHDGIEPEKLIETWNEGFATVTGGNTGNLKDRIRQFNGFFNRVVKKGDFYDLIYTPGKGVRLYDNDHLAGIITGLDFKKALFAIWLGDKPADGDLKKGMLGN